MNESENPFDAITNKIKELEEFFLKIGPVELPVSVKLPANKLTGGMWFGIYRCQKKLPRLAVKPDVEDQEPMPLLESKLSLRLACCEPAVLNKLHELLLRSREQTGEQAAKACRNIDEFLQANRKE